MRLSKFAEFKLNESLANPFIKTNSYESGDYHQAILDVAYGWLKSENLDYTEMVDKMKENFGEDFALLVLLGSYNYQVCNGGHSQYFANGYASAHEGGYGSTKSNIDLHNNMMNWLFDNSTLYNSTEGKKVYDIIEEAGDVFEKMLGGSGRCGRCGGDGETEIGCYCGGDPECPECEGTGRAYQTCSDCDGNGKIDPEEIYDYELEPLDDKYYDIYEDWMEFLNDYARKIIENQAIDASREL